MNELDARGLDYEAEQKRRAEDAATFRKTTDALYDAGKAARSIKQNLSLAEKLIQPGMAVQGLAAPLRTDFERLKALIGGDRPWAKRAGERASATQTFDKAISASILSDLKIMLGGLGQIRVAEIDLMNKAAPSIGNEPAANQAILELGRRGADIAQDLAQTAAWFDRGARVDQMGKLIVGADGRPVLYGGRPTREALERTLQAVYDNHPRKMSEEELDAFKTRLFGTGTRPAGPAAGRGVQLPQTPQPQGASAAPSGTRPPLSTFQK
jgi:hypothetical protein